MGSLAKWSKGKVFLTIPYIGYAVSFLKTPFGFILILGVPAIFLIILQILKIKHGIREEVEKRVKEKLKEATPLTEKIILVVFLVFGILSISPKSSSALLSAQATVTGVSFMAINPTITPTITPTPTVSPTTSPTPSPTATLTPTPTGNCDVSLSSNGTGSTNVVICTNSSSTTVNQTNNTTVTNSTTITSNTGGNSGGSTGSSTSSVTTTTTTNENNISQ
jgi:hypothetical protein